jgi:RNA recognition motif-containing protein
MQDHESDKTVWETHSCQQGMSCSSFFRNRSSSGIGQASYDKKQLDVGANLFIGNLDPMVDETMLYNTFSTFGPIASTTKVRVPPGYTNVVLTTYIAGRTRPTNGRIQRLRLRLLQRL